MDPDESEKVNFERLKLLSRVSRQEDFKELVEDLDAQLMQFVEIKIEELQYLYEQ